VVAGLVRYAKALLEQRASGPHVVDPDAGVTASWEMRCGRLNAAAKHQARYVAGGEIAVLWRCGLRRADALALQAHDVDLDARRDELGDPPAVD